LLHSWFLELRHPVPQCWRTRKHDCLRDTCHDMKSHASQLTIASTTGGTVWCTGNDHGAG
jgi:hypothetical protein